MHPGARFKSTQPVLYAKSGVTEAVRFYLDQLGFELAYLEGVPPTLAIVSRGEVSLFLVAAPVASLSDPPSGSPEQPLETARIRIAVEGIEELFAKSRARGLLPPGLPLHELQIKPWGLKEFSIRDLNGHWLIFHESPPAPGLKKEAANPPLQTARLRLEPLQLLHAEALFPLFRDPEVMMYWHTSAHVSLAETQQAVEEMHASASWWVITPPNSDEVIGFTGFVSVEDSAPVGMGYLLAPAYQRRGLGREAVAVAIQHVFSTWNAAYVELWIFEENVRSLHLARALGFKHERTISRAGAGPQSQKPTGIFWLRQSQWHARHPSAQS